MLALEMSTFHLLSCIVEKFACRLVCYVAGNFGLTIALSKSSAQQFGATILSHLALNSGPIPYTCARARVCVLYHKKNKENRLYFGF